MNHHILSIHETQQLFKTSKEGLHQSDAEERLLENGRNELVEKKKKPTWLIFFNQFEERRDDINISYRCRYFHCNWSFKRCGCNSHNCSIKCHNRIYSRI